MRAAAGLDPLDRPGKQASAPSDGPPFSRVERLYSDRSHVRECAKSAEKPRMTSVWWCGMAPSMAPCEGA